MRLQRTFFLFFLLLSGLAQAQYIVQNNGQWDTQARYKLPMHYGNVYFEKTGILIEQAAPEGTGFYAKSHHHANDHEEEITQHKQPQNQKYHTYKMRWIGASAEAEISGLQPLKTYHNYLLGNDKTKWQSKVPLFNSLEYNNLYEGIDVRFYFNTIGNLKYDIELSAFANPNVYKTEYQGADSLEITKEGVLIIYNSIAPVKEMKPYAYQIINGEKREIPCTYAKKGNTVFFDLGDYNTSEKLIIDPEIVFSTFTGSSVDNWGYTATNGIDGAAYGGGIVFGGTGTYPTVGAYSNSFNGQVIDIGISKFTADGSQLIYSTYLGGSSDEMPYSLVEGANKALYIFGNTGSKNFPMLPTSAYDTLNTGAGFTHFFGPTPYFYYNDGIDLFVVKLDSTGGTLLGSTFFGGTGIDGICETNVRQNGDAFRGEITLDNLDNCYIVSQTKSTDIPVSTNAAQATLGGISDAVIASFNSNLSTQRWATYFGGTDADYGYSISAKLNEVVLAGATKSADLQTHTTAFDKVNNETPTPTFDGFLLKLNQNTGAFEAATYTGTAGFDANYFIDRTDSGKIYTFGLTDHLVPQVGSNLFGSDEKSQVIQKYSGNLDTLELSTCFGDTSVAGLGPPLSPTAFRVDECGNLYLSGWGVCGGFPLSVNAFQSNASNSDFYFLVLDASLQKFNYATLFGGIGGDHVDGGTSRFAPDGTIYQGVCASCGGSRTAFPTSPTAYSKTNNSSNCNLAVVKFSTDSKKVVAKAEPLFDTVCIFTRVTLIDSSFNADYYLIEHPDSTVERSDSLKSVLIENYGLNRFLIIAVDTTCDLMDSTELFIYGIAPTDLASINIEYDSCQISGNQLTVTFESASYDGSTIEWNFGDGNTSTLDTIAYTYGEGGLYVISLEINNPLCDNNLFIYDTVQVHEIAPLNVRTFTEDCTAQANAQLLAGGQGYQLINWLFEDGQTKEGASVDVTFSEAGNKTFTLIAIDSICNRYDTVVSTVQADIDIETYTMPNVFTPNGDGRNDVFGLIGDFKEADFKNFYLEIYNRWGQLVYTASSPSSKWDGAMSTEILPEGVYYYLVNYLSACNLSETKKGYVHLIR